MMEELKLKCRYVLWEEGMASIYREEVLGIFLIAPLHATDLLVSVSSSSIEL